MIFFIEIERSILTFIWTHKRPWIAKAFLSQKRNTGGIMIWLQTILQSHSNKAAQPWYKIRHEDQWNRIEYPDTNPSSYSHLIFDKAIQSMLWRKDSLFNRWCWENWRSTWKRLKLDPSLSPCTCTNLKWIKDLNVIWIYYKKE
jgi:hypothetical protein